MTVPVDHNGAEKSLLPSGVLAMTISESNQFLMSVVMLCQQASVLPATYQQSLIPHNDNRQLLLAYTFTMQYFLSFF